MRHWQEDQRVLSVICNLRQFGGCILAVVYQRAVGKLATFWIAGGSGGVNDGGQIAQGCIGASGFQNFVRNLFTSLVQLGKVGGIDLPDMLHPWGLGANLVHPCQVLIILNKEGH